MAEAHPVVCTSVIGGYEALTELVLPSESSARFVCFTDDAALRSSTWEMEVIQPRWPMDPVRSARDVKIRLDRYLPEARVTLWVDNSVQLRVAPEAVLSEWLSDVLLAVPKHSFRASVLDEFAEVSTLGLDDPVRIYEQEAHYRVVDPGALDEPALWTGILARRMTAETRAFCSLWMEQVLRYSRRDQLSVNYALRRTSLPHRVVALDNFDSDLHRWPVAQSRLPEKQRRQFSAGFIPQELARASSEAQLQGLRQELADQHSRLESLERERADLQASSRTLTQLLESRSYRWGTGLWRSLVRPPAARR